MINLFLVILKYDLGKPIINVLKEFLKPGRRVYSNIAKLPRYFNGLGLAIISTSKGVIPDYKAREP